MLKDEWDLRPVVTSTEAASSSVDKDITGLVQVSRTTDSGRQCRQLLIRTLLSMHMLYNC